MKKKESNGSKTVLLSVQTETLRKKQNRTSTTVGAVCFGTERDTFNPAIELNLLAAGTLSKRGSLTF